MLENYEHIDSRRTTFPYWVLPRHEHDRGDLVHQLNHHHRVHYTEIKSSFSPQGLSKCRRSSVGSPFEFGGFGDARPPSDEKIFPARRDHFHFCDSFQLGGSSAGTRDDRASGNARRKKYSRPVSAQRVG